MLGVLTWRVHTRRSPRAARAQEFPALGCVLRPEHPQCMGGCRDRFGDFLPEQILLCGPVEQGHSDLTVCPPVTYMDVVATLGPPGPAGHCPVHLSWSRCHHPSCSTLGGGISWWCSFSPVPALPCPFPVGRVRAGKHNHGQRDVGRGGGAQPWAQGCGKGVEGHSHGHRGVGRCWCSG